MRSGIQHDGVAIAVLGDRVPAGAGGEAVAVGAADGHGVRAGSEEHAGAGVQHRARAQAVGDAETRADVAPVRAEGALVVADEDQPATHGRAIDRLLQRLVEPGLAVEAFAAPHEDVPAQAEVDGELRGEAEVVLEVEAVIGIALGHERVDGEGVGGGVELAHAEDEGGVGEAVGGEGFGAGGGGVEVILPAGGDGLAHVDEVLLVLEACLQAVPAIDLVERHDAVVVVADEAEAGGIGAAAHAVGAADVHFGNGGEDGLGPRLSGKPSFTMLNSSTREETGWYSPWRVKEARSCSSVVGLMLKLSAMSTFCP